MGLTSWQVPASTVAPSYSASECDCLVFWLRLAGRFVAVGFRAAAVLRTGAFLGVVVVGAGSVAVAVKLSCTAAPSVTSLVTTGTSDGVASSTRGWVGSASVEIEDPVSDDDEALSMLPSSCGEAMIWSVSAVISL